MSKDIKGLFEIHITVDPKDIFKLRMYCMDQTMKPIMAVAAYGDYPIQPMISKFKNGTYDEVFEKTKTIENEMREKYRINVVRVKIESMMHNEGVPLEPNDIWTNLQYYFEFHLKIPVKNSKEWDYLAQIAKEKNGHLSFNAFKKETVPLLTLRLPATIGSREAEKRKDELMDHLKTNRFHTNDGIQKEFSVYDTCPHLDDGWLY